MAKQLRAALYGRVSVKRNSKFAADDQLRVCRELAQRNSWLVVAEYKDEGISGGTSRRAQYQALRAAAKRRDFDIVVAEDSKRLWRALGEQFTVLDEWVNIGVDLVTVSGLDSRDQHFRMMISMQGAMAEHDLKECRYRIRRGLESRAKDGRATGGRVFGYNPAKGDAVTVNLEQAAVVRRIFREYVGGMSARSIAHGLNRDAIASPGSSWEGRDGKWRQSGVRVILNNRRYTGVVVWGAYKVQRKAGDSSSRRYLPGDAPIERRCAELRIIDDATWRAAQQRIKATAKACAIFAVPAKEGRAAYIGRGGKPLRHALSGLLKCAECNGSFIISDSRSYGCGTHRSGGEHACSVGQRLRRTEVEEAVFNGISEQMLAPDFLAAYIKWFKQNVACAQKANAGRGAASGKRLQEVERKIANMVDAIANGELRGNKSLTKRLQELEDERDQLARDRQPVSNVVSLLPRLEARYKALLRDLPALAKRDPEGARTLLQQLTGGLLVVAVAIKDEDGKRRKALAVDYALSGERLMLASGVSGTGGAGGGT
ncbi:recombinase family protein [Reyranella sp.]|uniref:recombinase family protein n=1 Tax=Reyranella sp. TaxID=1929291 RepID=UPI003D0E0418